MTCRCIDPMSVSPSFGQNLGLEKEARPSIESSSPSASAMLFSVPAGRSRQRILPGEEESFLVVGIDEKEVERLWILLLRLEGHQDPHKFASLGGLSGERGLGLRSATPNRTEVGKEVRSSTPTRTAGIIAGSAAAGAAAVFTTLAWGP